MTRILLLMAGGLTAIAVAQPRTPIVVELFTSEGCSSCPPADDVLTRLDRDQPVPGAEVIALSEHVTYWNSSAWHDPFSALSFSWRQFGYQSLFHLDSAYTPQMVVNGQTEVVGSDWDAVNKAIRAAVRTPQAMVTMAVKNGDTASIQVTHLPQRTEKADLMLSITEGDLESSVSGGENGGHKLRHTGVVRRLTTVGHLDPSSETYSVDTRLKIDSKWNRANLKLILFIQEQGARHVLGAGAIRP